MILATVEFKVTVLDLGLPDGNGVGLNLQGVVAPDDVVHRAVWRKTLALVMALRCWLDQKHERPSSFAPWSVRREAQDTSEERANNRERTCQPRWTTSTKEVYTSKE